MMKPIVYAMVFMLVAPWGCATESSRAPQGPLVIGEAAARQLNHLSLHGAFGDQADCSIEVWYPPHAISVEISGPDGPEELVQYESCYELAGGSIPRDVMAYRCPSDRIHEVPGSSGSSGDRRFVFGGLRGILWVNSGGPEPATPYNYRAWAPFGLPQNLLRFPNRSAHEVRPIAA